MARRYGDDEDEDALPWLEPAEPEDDEEVSRFPYRGLIVAGVVIVAVIAVLWFLAEWIGGGRGSDTVAATDEVPLIQAPEGPYKVRPENPGGLDVDAGSMTHSVAEGRDPGGELALDVIPEEPVPVVTTPPVRSAPVPEPGTPAAPPKAGPTNILPPAATAPAPKVAEKAVPKVAEKAAPKVAEKAAVPVKEAPKPEPKPEPAKPAGNVTVQLGAFNSAASADQVWSKLSGRVGALGGLRKTVQPVEAGGKTLYRLRAGGIASETQATSVCAAVAAAGEQCVIVR